MRNLLAVIFLLLTGVACGQTSTTSQNAWRLPSGSGAPAAASCVAGPPFVQYYTNTSTTLPTIYVCKSGTWTATAGGTTSVSPTRTINTTSPITGGGDLSADRTIACATCEVTGNKDATGGYAGLTLFKIDFKNAANTFTSFLANANSAARTYTFQNRDGTIADDTDLALKAPLASPTFTGTPLSTTAAVDTNTIQIATTAFVLAQAASANPIIDGTAAPGTSTRYARADHVHPTDTSRAPTASPTFTGTVALPTAITINGNTMTFPTTAQTIPGMNQTNTAGSSLVLDLSAASVTAGLKIPSAAGAAPTADGFIATNTTNHTHVWGSNGTTMVGAVAATGTGTATTCSNQFVSAVSSLVVPTCTTVTLAGAQFANQGTTTTVLHGNAAGNPSFAAVGINDVSGSTGTGSFVFSASPTFTGTLTAATTSFSGHMTIEGVTSTGAAGTGKFVFDTASRFNGKITVDGSTSDVLVGRYDSSNPTTSTNGYFKLSTNNVSATSGGLTVWYLNTDAYARGLELQQTGNLKIAGTATRGTTEGTNHLDIFDGTAPAGTLTNGISLYSTSGELRAMDASGNATLLSPHDHITNEWIFYSVNTVTGRVLKIDMERMMRALDARLGGGFVHEYMSEQDARPDLYVKRSNQ